MSVKVSIATIHDLEAVADMARHHAQEHSAVKEYDPDRVMSALFKFTLYGHPDYILLVAKESDTGKLLGYVAGYLSGYVHNHYKRANLEMIYCHPENRGWSGIKLIKAYKSWALQDPLVREVYVGVDYEESWPELLKFYESFGFTRSGGLCRLIRT